MRNNYIVTTPQEQEPDDWQSCLCKPKSYWDILTGKRVWYLQTKKNCPDHWRKYGWRVYYDLKRHLSRAAYTYTGRLSCRCYPDHAALVAALEKFVVNMRYRRRSPFFKWVNVIHLDDGCLHVHFIAQTDAPLDTSEVTKVWARIMAKAFNVNHTHGDVWCKQAKGPRGYLMYICGVHPRYPRNAPPWGNYGHRVYGRSR